MKEGCRTVKISEAAAERQWRYCVQKEERTNKRKGRKELNYCHSFQMKPSKIERKILIFGNVSVSGKKQKEHSWSVLCMTSRAEHRGSHRVCILPHESSLGSMEFAGQLAPEVVFDPEKLPTGASKSMLSAHASSAGGWAGGCSAGTFLTGRGGSAAQ